MQPEDIVFATVMSPLLGAALAFCAKLLPKGRFADMVEHTGALVGLGLPILVLIQLFPVVVSGQSISGVVGRWVVGIGITFRFDALAWLVNILGYTIGAAAWIYSLGAGPKGPAFTGVFLIQTAALCATIMTTDLFNLFVCLEILGIASYVLIPTSRKAGATLASFSYLMVSASAMVFFLLGTYGFYRLTGALSYEGISAGLQAVSSSDTVLSIVSLALLVSAIAIRVAVMPLYGWLPDAHALAPHAVSAVLSGVLIKTPLFALSRILFLFPAGMQVGELMSIAGGITAVLGVVIALSQEDAKRLLAYHSISQIGYVVAAWGMAISIGVDTPVGTSLMVAAFLHAFYHAVFKGLLFLSIGTTIDVANERNVYILRDGIRKLRDAGECIPVTFICFVIGALAISAIPPLNGFVSKTAITHAMKGSLNYYLLSAAAVGTVASFIKLSRIYWPTGKYGKRQIELDDHRRTSSIPRSTPPGLAARLTAQSLLAVLCVVGGVAAHHILTIVGTLFSSSGATSATPPILYATGNLLKTGATTLGGVLLFFIAISKPGSTVLHTIRTRPRSFQGLFVSFSLGTAVLAAYLVVGKF
jgi:multicomponent Na+:H+ antiporter subunit D